MFSLQVCPWKVCYIIQRLTDSTDSCSGSVDARVRCHVLPRDLGDRAGREVDICAVTSDELGCCVKHDGVSLVAGVSTMLSVVDDAVAADRQVDVRPERSDHPSTSQWKQSRSYVNGWPCQRHVAVHVNLMHTGPLRTFEPQTGHGSTFRNPTRLTRRWTEPNLTNYILKLFDPVLSSTSVLLIVGPKCTHAAP